MEVQSEGREHGYVVKIKDFLQFFSLGFCLFVFVFSSSEEEFCAKLRRGYEGLRGQKV